MLDRLLIALVVICVGVGAYLLLQAWQRSLASSALQPTGRPTLLYFRSDACVPCNSQARFLEQVRAEFGDQIMIEKIDADLERQRADQFGVFTVPTTLVVDATGQVRHANYGLVEPSKLVAQLRDVS